MKKSGVASLSCLCCQWGETGTLQRNSYTLLKHLP